MIELTPLARPYAKALFASALESKNIDEMASELKTMALASKTDGVIKSWVKKAVKSENKPTDEKKFIL